MPSSVRKPHFENGLEASHTQQHLAVFSTFLNDQNQSAGAPSRIWRSQLVILRTELRDIPVNFSTSLGLLLDQGLSLTTYQFSYTLDILFHSDSPRLSATGLPRDRVCCVNLAQKVSNRTNCPILVRKLFTNMFCTPSLFLTKEFNQQSFVKGMFINKLWRNNDVTLMTLHCVSCRVGSLHLLGSSFGTLKNICTKFTYTSHKWFYFSMHYTFYLHINWYWRA